MVLFLLTQKSAPLSSLPILNTDLLIFTVTPVELIVRVMYFISMQGRSWLIIFGRCCFFSSLSEGSILGSVCSGYEILYRLWYTKLVSIATTLNIRYKFWCAEILCCLEANLLKCLWFLVLPNIFGKDLPIYSFS